MAATSDAYVFASAISGLRDQPLHMTSYATMTLRCLRAAMNTARDCDDDDAARRRCAHGERAMQEALDIAARPREENTPYGRFRRPSPASPLAELFT